ncbi:hypothetical protein SDC9_110817 [bioreactor metagenome]|uniref:Uncharacterized protein n=1 Tax=bioreactor metagenome TaxID=1076179 RepID=A0A645BF18_9ZZZZ
MAAGVADPLKRVVFGDKGHDGPRRRAFFDGAEGRIHSAKFRLGLKAMFFHEGDERGGGRVFLSRQLGIVVDTVAEPDQFVFV